MRPHPAFQMPDGMVDVGVQRGYLGHIRLGGRLAKVAVEGFCNLLFMPLDALFQLQERGATGFSAECGTRLEIGTLCLDGFSDIHPEVWFGCLSLAVWPACL